MSDTPMPPQGPQDQKPIPADPTPAADSPAPGAPDPADVEKNKIFAACSYLGILFLVPLLAAKDSPYAKFHCNQGILLFGVSLVGGFGLGIVWMILSFIPLIKIVAGCLSCFVFPLFWLLILVYVILGVVNAMTGKMKRLPLFPAMTIIK